MEDVARRPRIADQARVDEVGREVSGRCRSADELTRVVERFRG